MISRASIEDAAGISALIAASFDDRLATVAGVRHRFAASSPEFRSAYWRAVRGATIVGWAYGGLDAFAPDRSAGQAGIVVHPANRREGIGSALWEVVSAHLDEIEAKRIVVHSRADEASKSFAAARGFTLAATETSSAVDPRSLAEPPPPPAGIELRRSSSFLDDPERVFVADHESFLDEPGPSDTSGMTYETWQRHIWGHPDCDHELSIVAVAGDDVAGMTYLFSDRATGRAGNGGTGVIPAHRGKGIGLVMKQHSLALAAAAGITRVITQNDATNAPMLAINGRLGYEPFSVGHSWVLERADNARVRTPSRSSSPSDPST